MFGTIASPHMHDSRQFPMELQCPIARDKATWFTLLSWTGAGMMSQLCHRCGSSHALMRLCCLRACSAICDSRSFHLCVVISFLIVDLIKAACSRLFHLVHSALNVGGDVCGGQGWV